MPDFFFDFFLEGGGGINSNIDQCVGSGVLLHKDIFLLEECGGPVNLTNK